MLKALAGKGTSYPSNTGPYAGEMEVVTPMTTMDVTCPPGCKEGDQVRIQSPAGQVIQVAVPPGVSAGQVFQAQVPAVQQLHQGMPVVQPMVVAQPMAVAQPIAPIAAVPAGVVASAPVEPIDYSSACMEEKRREPGWVVPPSVVVSGACSEVELDYEKAAIPAGQQRSMVSVPGVCATLKLKVPTVGPAVVNVRDRAMGEINWKKREFANEVPGAKEVELTGSVGFCSELIVKYMSTEQSSKDAGKHADHNDTTRNWTRYEP